MAVLAGNLDRFRHAIWDAFPGTVVGWIGDAAHMTSCSDHNEDACGVVHAIDAMQPAGTEAAAAIVNAAVGRSDVEYVIHNGTIWTASTGWVPHVYTGSDPHTSHVHISGRHGSSCFTAATCVGYSHIAEANTTPWPLTLPQSVTSHPHHSHLEEEMYQPVPEGVAFNSDAGSTWLDITKAIALAIPKVGDCPDCDPAGSDPTAWGGRWIYLAGNQSAIVRVVSNGGGWSGVDVAIAPADGGHVIGLPAGTTQAYIGYKSGSGATFMVKGKK